MGVTLDFLKSLGTSPILHDFSEVMESSRVTTSVSSLGTCGCIPSGFMDLCILRLPSWSLTKPSMTWGKYSFLWPSSLISEFWDSHWGKEGIQCFLLCVFHYQDNHLNQQQPHISPNLPFSADAFVKPFLMSLMSSARLNSKWALAFLVTSLPTVTIFL